MTAILEMLLINAVVLGVSTGSALALGQRCLRPASQKNASPRNGVAGCRKQSNLQDVSALATEWIAQMWIAIEEGW